MTALDPQTAALADAVAARLATLLEVPGDLLTVNEAAQRLGVSGKTVRNMLDRGKLRGLRVEGRRVFRPEEIDRYIAAREAEEGTG